LFATHVKSIDGFNEQLCEEVRHIHVIISRFMSLHSLVEADGRSLKHQAKRGNADQETLAEKTEENQCDIMMTSLVDLVGQNESLICALQFAHSRRNPMHTVYLRPSTRQSEVLPG
jgi:hypothetical protein